MLKLWVLEPAYEGAGPENSTRYIAMWERGYIQPLNEWRQFLHPQRFNWITFDFAHIELDYDRCMFRHVTFEFVLLGLGFRIHQNVMTEEELEADRKRQDDFWGEVEARSTQSEQLEKLWALLPDGVKETVDADLREQIELGLSEPEDGKRKVVVSPKVLKLEGITE